MRTEKEIDKIFSEDEIKKRINHSNYWFHSIKLGSKVTTPGIYFQANWDRILKTIPNDLSGKTVLDVGARTGGYAFECEKRGAKEILAIDNWQNQGPDGSRDKPFQICKEILDSKVEMMELDFFDIESLNRKFDIILFLGVIYHLMDPLLAIKKIYNVCNELAILEGAILQSLNPIAYFLDPGEVGNDPSNKFLMSPTLIINYAKEIGFKEVQFLDYIGTPSAIKSSEKYSDGKEIFIRNRGIFYLKK